MGRKGSICPTAISETVRKKNIPHYLESVKVKEKQPD